MEIFRQKPLLGTPLNKKHPLAKGLVGCWLMNEGAGDTVADLSGNKLTLVKGGGVASPTWIGNKFGNGLSFDGGDYLLHNSKGFDDAQGTIIIWFKFNSHAAIQYPFSSTDEGTIAQFFLGIRITTLPVFQVLFWNTGTFTNLIYVNEALLDGVWYQIAVSSNGNSYSLYINGQSKTVSIMSGNNNGKWLADIPNRDNVVIGALKYSSTAYYLDGIVSHNMVYNRALSPQEIRQSFISPFCMFERKPIIPIVDISGNVTIYPAAAALTVTIQDPVIDIVQSVTVEPTAIGLAAIVNSPAIVGDVVISPSAISLVSTLSAPEIIGDVSITPSVMSITVAAIDPAVIGDVIISPSAISLVSALHSPTINISGSVTVEPSAIEMISALHDPTIIAEGLPAEFLYGILTTRATLSILSIHDNRSIISVYDNQSILSMSV